MSTSSTIKICAVVVPEGMQWSHDVLRASSNLVNRTPYPFGLSIYAGEEHQPLPESPQKLLYVPERAADDRAPERNRNNGMGVRAGWYLIAPPGRFRVHVSHVNRNHCGLPWENGLQVHLEVDGQDTNASFQYEQNDESSADDEDFVFHGFMEKSIPSPGNGNMKKDTFRPFQFECISNAAEGNRAESPGIGSITLKVYAGELEELKATSKTRTYKYARKQLSAKAVAKNGLTIKVSRRHPPISRTVEYSDCYLKNARILPGAAITIHVRERSWLRSRRLINGDDEPITYDVFRNLLRALRPRTRLIELNEVTDVDGESARKRSRIKVDPIRPGEIIDLT